MSLQLSTADIEPEDVTEAELHGIAELRARILKAQGRDVPLPEQVCTCHCVELQTISDRIPPRAHAKRLPLFYRTGHQNQTRLELYAKLPAECVSRAWHTSRQETHFRRATNPNPNPNPNQETHFRRAILLRFLRARRSVKKP